MPRIVIFRKTAHFNYGRRDIVDLLQSEGETHSIRLDRDSLHGRNDSFIGRLAGMETQFEINADDGYTVTETFSVGMRYHLFWIFPYLFLSSYFYPVTRPTLQKLPISIVLVLAVLSAISIILWLSITTQETSLLEQTRTHNENLQSNPTLITLITLIAGLATLGLSLKFAFEGIPPLPLHLFYSSLVVAISLSIISPLLGQPLSTHSLPQIQVPSITRSLILTMLLIVSYGGVFAFAIDSALILGDVDASISRTGFGASLAVAQQIGFLVLALLLAYFFAKLILNKGLTDYHSFSESPSRHTTLTIRSLFFVFAVTLAYGMVFVGVKLGRTLFDIGFGARPLLSVTIVLLILVISYFLVGIAYQTFESLRHYRRLFRRSTPIAVDRETRARVRRLQLKDGQELSNPVYWAAALSTGLDSHIFLSEDLLDDFSHEEIQAVIEHEKAHIRNGEALLSFYIPFISLVTLVGRNVLYSLIDYHKREFRADQEAITHGSVNADMMYSVLEQFHAADFENTRTEIAAVGLLPFGGRSQADTKFITFFDLFFGDYAIRTAHPDIDERQKQIRDM